MEVQRVTKVGVWTAYIVVFNKMDNDSERSLDEDDRQQCWKQMKMLLLCSS